MKKLALLPMLLLRASLAVNAMQAGTPQGALEEIATTDKPEVIARHLPELVRKRIENLAGPEKKQAFNKLLSMKAEQLSGCTIRHSSDVDAWEIINDKGESAGKVKLAQVFISGLDSLVSLKLEGDSASHSFIVAMHLEGDEWRIDNFGAWDATEPGLAKLARKPTLAEENETAALRTLTVISEALQLYAWQFPNTGYPAHLQKLIGIAGQEASEENAGLLDASMASEPLMMSGYEFRYTLLRRSNVVSIGSFRGYDPGSFQLTATPFDFGTTGSKHYLANPNGLHVTTENREATDDDPAPEDPE